jgi:hypothetical protein
MILRLLCIWLVFLFIVFIADARNHEPEIRFASLFHRILFMSNTDAVRLNFCTIEICVLEVTARKLNFFSDASKERTYISTV